MWNDQAQIKRRREKDSNSKRKKNTQCNEISRTLGENEKEIVLTQNVSFKLTYNLFS